MEALLKEFTRLKREEQLKELTAAEREVFDMIEQGYTQSQIGRMLHKTESTLKNQVNKLLKKLGVRSSREAVKKVRRKGLVMQSRSAPPIEPNQLRKERRE
jgi:NarL family two-component system response regulator LiaR